MLYNDEMGILIRLHPFRVRIAFTFRGIVREGHANFTDWYLQGLSQVTISEFGEQLPVIHREAKCASVVITVILRVQKSPGIKVNILVKTVFTFLRASHGRTVVSYKHVCLLKNQGHRVIFSAWIAILFKSQRMPHKIYELSLVMQTS